MAEQIGPLDVLDFWWSAGQEKWYGGGEDFDRKITEQFGALHTDVAAGKLDGWLNEPASALALIIVLDQFSRNMFRGTATAFATDPQALAAAKLAVERGFDRAFPVPHKCFFYLPFMHSEDMADQERCIDLHRVAGADNGYHYALIHMDVIRRFGRFPHRNDFLGRTSTEEELAYLAAGGFSA